MRLAVMAAMVAVGMGGCSPAADKPVTESAFGQLPDGRAVRKYTLDNGKGMTASILSYGGIIQSLNVPGRNGKVDDVVLGQDTLDGYLHNQATANTNSGR